MRRKQSQAAVEVPNPEKETFQFSGAFVIAQTTIYKEEKEVIWLKELKDLAAKSNILTQEQPWLNNTNFQVKLRSCT